MATGGQSAETTSRILSIVRDIGSYASTCGYCHSTDSTSISHGMFARQLTVYDYQDLIDQGWRRSGSLLYKPNLDTTCCPTYTIRLDVHEFKPLKVHTRLLRKWHRLLAGVEDGSMPTPQSAPEQNNDATVAKVSNEVIDRIESLLSKAIECCIQARLLPHAEYAKPKVVECSEKQRKALPCDVKYTTACCFALAAMARKLHYQAEATSSPTALAESVAAEFNKISELQISAVAGKGYINFKQDLRSEEDSKHFKPSKPGKTSTVPKQASGTAVPAVHWDSCQVGSITESCWEVDPTTNCKLELKLLPNQFSPEEFDLYVKYQVAQHGDDPNDLSKGSFKRFLVETPLIPVSQEQDPDAPSCGYGSFHQQYRLNGRLIAVGVVDILPRCLSSKYFFWDPDFAHLALGRFSALKEIEWVNNACKESPKLHYYYMGFYIHTCPKMRYKAEYQPSDLLCPEKKIWVRFSPTIKEALDTSPVCAISNLQGVVTKPALFIKDGPSVSGQAPWDASVKHLHQMLDNALLLVRGAAIQWKMAAEIGLFRKNTVDEKARALSSWLALVGETHTSLVYEF